MSKNVKQKPQIQIGDKFWVWRGDEWRYLPSVKVHSSFEEAEVVGETKVSWLVLRSSHAALGWGNPSESKFVIKVPKKNPYEVLFTDEARDLWDWADTNRRFISAQVQRASPEVLRQVADLLGYVDRRSISYCSSRR